MNLIIYSVYIHTYHSPSRNNIRGSDISILSSAVIKVHNIYIKTLREFLAVRRNKESKLQHTSYRKKRRL